MNNIKSLSRQFRIRIKALLTVGFIILLASCGEPPQTGRAVYLLLDTSGTYTAELDKARSIINYLLGTLNSGDSLGVALINSGSFTEKNIVAKVTFDDRPSVTNNQKRLFKENVDTALDQINRGSANTDITGGILQAAEYLTETGAAAKHILIFSDLEEDLQEGHIRDFPIDLADIHVVALNVTKLRTDNIDPRDYQNRLRHWQTRVEKGGGDWRVVNDLENLESMIHHR